jgi:hypothetical protein
MSELIGKQVTRVATANRSVVAWRLTKPGMIKPVSDDGSRRW